MQPINNPQPGEVWRHRKHDPENGKWHEYEIIGVTQAIRRDLNATTFWGMDATHTETGERLSISCCKGSMFFVVAPGGYTGQLFVLYKRTNPNDENVIHIGNPWARPLSMFMDGRFTLVPFHPIP